MLWLKPETALSKVLAILGSALGRKRHFTVATPSRWAQENRG